MPQEVIDQIHRLAWRAKAKNKLTFTNARNIDLDMLYADLLDDDGPPKDDGHGNGAHAGVNPHEDHNGDNNNDNDENDSDYYPDDDDSLSNSNNDDDNSSSHSSNSDDESDNDGDSDDEITTALSTSQT